MTAILGLSLALASGLTAKAMRRLILPLLLLLAACHGGPRAPLPEDRLIRLADDEVKSLDPQKATDVASMRVALDQFEGLTRMDGDGRAEPGLAARWTISADGRTWRFALRPGLRFSDGQPITPATFAATFARLRDAATASPNAGLFTNIESVAAEGGDVVVRLAAPMPSLPELLALPAMAALPVHRIAAQGEGWTAERPLVTSGPYRLTDWRLNERLRLERNPHWHDGAAAIPEIEWRPVGDRLTALRSFAAGEADISNDFPPTRIGWIARNLPRAAHVAPLNGSYYFVFDTTRPPFDDVRVRRALSIAVDRRWIAQKLIGPGTQPAWGIVPPAVAGAPGAYRPRWADWSAEQRANRRARAVGRRRLRAGSPARLRHPLQQRHRSPAHRGGDGGDVAAAGGGGASAQQRGVAPFRQPAPPRFSVRAVGLDRRYRRAGELSDHPSQ